MPTNINQIMFQLINAIGICYDGVVFCRCNFALRDIKHALPPINNFPLFAHTGDVGVTGVNYFTGFLIVFRARYCGFGNGIGIALVGRAHLLFIKSRSFHHLIQRLNLIIFCLITFISSIFIRAFVTLYCILSIFIFAV